MERATLWVVAIAALIFAGAGAYGAHYYLTQSQQATDTKNGEENRQPPVSWNNFSAKLINLEFFYPAQWGTPEEDLTVRGDERQYILSFDKAPTIFAGSMTDGFSAFDPKVVEVAVSRTTRAGDTVSLYLGEAEQYKISDYQVIQSTRAGDVGLGIAANPGRAGFEGGDRVGVVFLADPTFRVLIFHFHKFASDQELQTLLESVRIP